MARKSTIEKLKARELKEVLKGLFNVKRHPKEEKNEEDIIWYL